MTSSEPFAPFRTFLAATEAASPGDFPRVAELSSSTADFDQMKQHVLETYAGVEVSHSFSDENGQVFDCVPIEQQPALRNTPGGLAQPTDAPGALASGAGDESQVETQLRPDRLDPYGNSMWCPPGTIAIRRITLDELTRKGNLREFFRKGPVIADTLEITERAAAVHKYAHARQTVDNLGGHSFLNIWTPPCGSGQFSLSQHWYAAGSPVQTVECGWQVYPDKYRMAQPALFIYWTADGYNNTGNYNLDKAAFVQTNRNWAFGGALGPTSIFGGQQYELEMAFYLTGGNWWLYLKGTSAAHAVGYYPASLFGSGPLRSKATTIDYGGETVGATSWPPMGSGSFANAGWQRSAYQRDIQYFPTAGGGVQASLNTSQPSPGCYTISNQTAAAPWNKYFYFGGPGGSGC